MSPVMKRLAGLLLVLALLTGCSTGAPTTIAPASSAPGAAVTTATPGTTSAAAPTPALAATAAATASVAGTRVPPTAATGATATRSSATPGVSPAARATVTAPARSAQATPGAANTTAAAGEALIEQAVGYLLDQYVDPLATSTLYAAAYDGAVATLRASGKNPQANPPALSGARQADIAAFKAAYLALAGSAGTDINQSLLAHEAIRTVAERVGECHTAFLDPEQYQSVTAGLSGTNTYGGIGVTIRTQTRPATIGDIFPNTPAAASGLRPGDALIRVGDTDVTDLPADSISPLVRGQAGTPVTLTIQRPGEGTTRAITITRAEITVPVFVKDIRTADDGTKIGYMKLYSFSTGTDAQLAAALADFQQKGVTGWVLDLRDNGGGYIDVLSKIASRFLAGGQPVAYRIERGGAEEPIPTDPSLYISAQQPFAILINGGSASASEALASAAADDGFARLFGQKTAGCLAGATTYRLADGSAMQVTIWKIVSPQRRAINQIGQQPDQEVQPDPTGQSDPVLDAAIAWLVAQPKR
jgi:carboxyl-terminal processing protease